MTKKLFNATLLSVFMMISTLVQAQGQGNIPRDIFFPIIEEIKRALMDYENGRQGQGQNEDGSISWTYEARLKPLRPRNFEVEANLLLNDYIVSENEMEVIFNGDVKLYFDGFWNPLISGLTRLGMPFITKIDLKGPVEISGDIHKTIEVDFHWNIADQN